MKIVYISFNIFTSSHLLNGRYIGKFQNKKISLLLMSNFKQHGNSSEWLSNFPEQVRAICDGKRPNSPLHVEIHPHSNNTEMCNNRCYGCTGLGYAMKDNSGFGIDSGRLIQTIDSFKGRVQKVVFSGCCVEPLMYPQFADVIRHSRDADLDISIYSNFYFATPEITGLLSRPVKKEFVRASLNAGTREAYNLVHRPADTNSFDIILENIRRLAGAKDGDSPFFYLTYLLSQHNCDNKNLDFVVRFASSTRGIDKIRFSVYQKPLGRKMPRAVAIPQRLLDDSRKHLEDLKQKYQRQDFDVEITSEEIVEEQKQKGFSQCSVQDVFAVIGYDGSVYPCTAMASPFSPEQLKFGNINKEDFWDIWSKKNTNFSLEGCLDCTRAEFEINNWFHQLRK